MVSCFSRNTDDQVLLTVSAQCEVNLHSFADFFVIDAIAVLENNRDLNYLKWYLVCVGVLGFFDFEGRNFVFVDDFILIKLFNVDLAILEEVFQG